MNDITDIDEPFWHGLLAAVEAEPVQLNSLPCASGLKHPLIAAGIDSSRRRMVVVSRAETPRLAALTLADLQASFRAVQVVMIRFDSAPGDNSGAGDAARAEESDLRLGLCAVRAADFTAAQIASLKRGEVETARSALRAQHLLQYFFPAPDHLALALIERWRFATIPQAIDQLVRAPDLGHPFGPPEIVREYGSFTDMIQELQHLGLVQNLDQGLEITESGRETRAVPRRRPREAMADKLINRLSASLQFKPIWLPVIRRQHT